MEENLWGHLTRKICRHFEDTFFHEGKMIIFVIVIYLLFSFSLCFYSQPKPVEINQALVDSLLDLEQQIAALERKNVIKQCELKTDQVNRISQQVQNMVRQQQQLAAQT